MYVEKKLNSENVILFQIFTNNWINMSVTVTVFLPKNNITDVHQMLLRSIWNTQVTIILRWLGLDANRL